MFRNLKIAFLYIIFRSVNWPATIVYRSMPVTKLAELSLFHCQWPKTTATFQGTVHDSVERSQCEYDVDELPDRWQASVTKIIEILKVDLVQKF